MKDLNVSGACHCVGMTSSIDALLGSVTDLADEWSGAICVGGAVSGPPNVQFDVERMSDSGLLRAVDAAFDVKRQADALIARLAGQVEMRSRSSLGPDGMAKQNGNPNAMSLIAERGLISDAEASRLCRVGAATAEQIDLLGERMPAAYPLVAAALDTGAIPVDSAGWIVSKLDQATPRADRADLDEAERALVEFAGEHPADMVRKFAIRWRDALDADGIEPREEALIALRSVRRSTRANGMKRYILDLDAVSAAYIDAAIDAEVRAAIREVRFEANGSPDGCDDVNDASLDPRTIAQMGADAIVDLARHGIGCTDSSAPLQRTTIVVRMSEEALRTGLGEAQIDGSDEPISAGTARRLAAEGGIIPVVLGGKSEVLDFGATKRLFSRAQRIALAERDDGCAWANCKRPPSHAEAHHIEWWSVRKWTNLLNGVLLCSCHHHRVHRDGWQIQVVDNVVWFIPPSSVDIYRKPRRGGRLPFLELPSLAG